MQVCPTNCLNRCGRGISYEWQPGRSLDGGGLRIAGLCDDPDLFRVGLGGEACRHDLETGENGIPDSQIRNGKRGTSVQTENFGAFIWKQVDTADCVEEIVRRLVAAYKVTEKEAREDVYGFLGELYRRDIVLEIPELDSMEKRDIGNQ